MGLGRQRGQKIDHGVEDTAVPGVRDLLAVLGRIVDAFDDGALAHSQLIH